MNKKAIQVTILTLILIIVTFIVLFVIVEQINSYLHEANAREYCRLSVVAMQKTRVAGQSTGIFTIDCPMKYVDIKKKDLPKQAKASLPSNVPQAPVSIEKREEHVKRKIADAMYDCWYQMGSGAHTDFEDAWWKDTEACLICSRITFEKPADYISPQGLAKLNSWLEQNYLAGASKTYSSMLSFQGNRRYYIEDSYSIDPNSNYYVMFVGINDANNLNGNPAFSKNFELSSYINIGISSNPYSLVYVVKEEHLADLGCGLLLN